MTQIWTFQSMVAAAVYAAASSAVPFAAGLLVGAGDAFSVAASARGAVPRSFSISRASSTLTRSALQGLYMPCR